MKKALLPFVAVILVISYSSCKKCFRCFNECTQCSIVVNSHTFNNVYCRDSFNTVEQYQAAINADTSLGYTCAEIAPTYDRDFCSNKPGEDMYPDYFNKGNRVTCNEK